MNKLNQSTKNIIFFAIFAILLGLLVYKMIYSNKSDEVITEGYINFKLKSLDGKTYSISDFRGKKILINFFATWCPPCKEEIPNLISYYEENKNDVIIIGVDIAEDINKVKQFVKEKGITYPVLLDTQGTISKAFGFQYIPTSYFLDKTGKKVNEHSGYLSKSDLIKIFNSIK
ncbi:TlpA family protein disulfide reductase [Caldicellulosiruptoraceae bacterium PP1]